MFEKWKKCLDKTETCGAQLTDLSRAFGCLPHKLLSTKQKELKLTAVLVVRKIFSMVPSKVQF